MTLSSWADTRSALDIKDEKTAEAFRDFIEDYVKKTMDLKIMPSDHKPYIFRGLIVQLQRKYPFVQISNKYPENPTTHERVIRSFAMRCHNMRRANAARRQQNEDDGDESSSASRSTPEQQNASRMQRAEKRNASGAVTGRDAKRVRIVDQLEARESFIEFLLAHGEHYAPFIKKLGRSVGGKDKVEGQIKAMSNKSFKQLYSYVQEVAVSSAPVGSETKVLEFIITEVMFDYLHDL
ncbi:hypothetical protein CVT26_000582 [Gymnopilus dilepis]|uniref:Uncharacterized protein n=1 Tax=Gymnopilus dilepis TaxID=231916 RepID=A0A409VHD3_9AGAR|nr:hypothetical protein CVT26_000582 [Gymnopilus dilepis]